MAAIDIFSEVSKLMSETAGIQRVGESSYIRLPMLYPSGAQVTLRVSASAEGLRVSDHGFAFEEGHSYGADQSFYRKADTLASRMALVREGREIYVDIQADQLFRAICDVSTTSWQVAEHVVSRVWEEHGNAIAEHLAVKLFKAFDKNEVNLNDPVVVGASSTDWDVTATVKRDGRLGVFHVVSNHAQSVFRTCTAFGDIAAREDDPVLVSVVESKSAMGKDYSLLGQAGKVIQVDADEQVYVRAFAA